MTEPASVIESENSVERFVYTAFVASDGRLRAIWRFLLAVVVVVVANVAAATFASGAGQGRLFELIYRSLALAFVLGGFCLLLKVADGVDGNPLPAMGLSFRKPWLRDASKGSLIGFVLIFIAYVVIRFTCNLTVNITLSRRTGELALAELFILATAAMLEEAAFRGYPLQRLMETFENAARWLLTELGHSSKSEHASRYAAAAAVLVWSAGAFGSVHFLNPAVNMHALFNTMLVGVMIGIAYLRTRSLWMPWGVHFAWNTSLGLLLGLPVSGITQFAVVIHSRADGPLWITGGKYGIEGSALGTAVIVMGIVLVVLFVKPRQSEALSANPAATLDQNSSAGIQL